MKFQGMIFKALVIGKCLVTFGTPDMIIWIDFLVSKKVVLMDMCIKCVPACSSEFTVSTINPNL